MSSDELADGGVRSLLSRASSRPSTEVAERIWRRRARRILPPDQLESLFETAAAADDLQSQRYVMLHLLWDLQSVADVPGDVLEIGSYRGKTTVFLSEAIERLGLEKQLVTINPHSTESIERGCNDANAASTRERFVEATASLSNHEHYSMRSAEAAERLQDDRFSLVFVDGDHSYEGVMTDYRTFAPLLSDTGRMVFDDYRNPTWPGVGRAVEGVLADGELVVDRRLKKTIHLTKRPDATV